MSVVRRTHHCRRCGSPIDPGDVYAALDVLDGKGRLRVLLCDACAEELRAFVGDEGQGDGGGDNEGQSEPDGRDAEEPADDCPGAEPGSKPV